MTPASIYDWMNVLGCVALLALAVYLTALLVSLARHGLGGPVHRAAVPIARQVARRLNRAAGEAAEVLRECRTGEVGGATSEAARRLERSMRREVVDGVVSRSVGAFPPLAAAIEECRLNGVSDQLAIRRAAANGFANWRRGWQHRFGLLMFAAPPAGAAPTLSGAAAALTAFAQAKGDPAALQAGLGIALITTYIGCGLSIVAAVAALLASRLVDRESARLASLVAYILQARRNVLDARGGIVKALDTPHSLEVAKNEPR